MEFTLEDLMGLDTAPKKALNRRLFIGGSDARIIMSPDEAALIRSGRKNVAKSNRWTSTITWLSNSASQPRR